MAPPLKFNRLALPIDDVDEQLLENIHENHTCIIIGETGCGKSTQLPQICKNMGLPGQIAITQPRRVAAMSLAARVATERTSDLGDKVGYRVRFEAKCTEYSEMVYMTDGMLLREAMQDALLTKYSVIIVDEAHERSIHTDVLLYTLKLAQKQRNEDMSKFGVLKLVIMSATMNADLFSDYYGGAPVYAVKGRTFPVEVFYANALTGDGTDYEFNVMVTILQAHEQEPIDDDILVFLTGREEIEAIAERLREMNDKLSRKMTVLPLYAALISSQQQRVFEPVEQGHRKVILSTNIAETSLTIPGVRIVIDSGKVKQKSFNAGDGIDVLRVERISKAQANQRAGRAGRESSGKCYRVYSEKDFEKMQPNSVAEILRSNLSSVIMDLIAMGLTKLKSIKLIEQPDAEMMDSAEKQLIGLNAIEVKKNGKMHLTEAGKIMVRFPVEPPLAKVLLASNKRDCSEEALIVISLLSSEELFVRSEEESAAVIRRKISSSEGDHVTMLNAFNMYKSEKKKAKNNTKILGDWAKQCGFNLRALAHAAKVCKQLREIAQKEGFNVRSCGSERERLRKALAMGLFMNACEYDNVKENYRMLLSPNTKVRIHPTSVLHRSKPAHIVFSQLVKTTDLYAKDVSVIDKTWIEDAISDFKRRK